MQHTFADESGRLVVELHRILSEIDPARWHAGAAEAAREKLRAVQAKLTQLTSQRWPKSDGPLLEPLTDLAKTLATNVPSEDDTGASARARWMAFRKSVVPSYLAIESALRRYEVHVPSLRPSNLRRVIFHVSSASLAMAVLYFTPSMWWCLAIAGPLAAIAWTLEITRRTRPRMNAAIMRLFAPIAHPHEYRRVNSGTWYLTALVALSLPLEPLPGAIGLAALGLGDPAASLVGRKLGRVRLIHGRTLEGTLAFAVVAAIAGTGAALVFAPGIALGSAILLASIGAVAGAVAELTSLRIDDNLTVPVATAAAVFAASLALGIPA